MSAEDIEGMRRIQASFCQYLDDGNIEGVLSLFTEDGKVHGGGKTYNGREEIKRFFEDSYSGWAPGTQQLHTLSDPVFKIAAGGLTAECVTNLTNFRCHELGTWTLNLVDRHHDRYRKVDGKWLCSEKGMEERGSFRRRSAVPPNPLSI